ncbi:hypothetical protein CORMATOL_00791 [Corynebacterium matruchotii ATCC 33806]|uniref:Uncharacterized protein n=1 Tax=Corynebacterium matruchotii ATCC 33806 TaxID=566549 RepID=C0E1E0_9CORY|nr:hypothetical protein CORMATOL_00791 [Corynebacterium matruchotii ATCC 33806]
MANNHTLFAYCLLYDDRPPRNYRLRSSSILILVGNSGFTP